MNTVHVTILVLYLCLMVGIGAWFSRSKMVATADDYGLFTMQGVVGA